MTRCRHHPKTPSGFASNFRHQCRRNAVKNGLCAIHQPGYVKPSEMKAIERHESERTGGERGKILARIETAKAAQTAARAAAERMIEEADAERHAAELALRRLDQGTPGYSKT